MAINYTHYSPGNILFSSSSSTSTSSSSCIHGLSGGEWEGEGVCVAEGKYGSNFGRFTVSSTLYIIGHIGERFGDA